jgi:hypothetical protein
MLSGASSKDFSGSQHTRIMNGVYMQIIRAAQPDPVDGWIHRFETFVGAIVLLQDPLPAEVLAALLGVDVNDIVNRDSCEMGPEFYIDPALHHMRIAEHCSRIMNDCLKLQHL